MQRGTLPDRCYGITLIEVMVVLIIVGILAAMALPRFPRAIESTKAKEAVVALQQIRTGERIYRMEENTYFYSSGDGDLTETVEINDAIGTYLDVRDKRNWDYDVTFVGTEGSTFVATATRLGGGGDYQGKTITINEAGPPYGGDWELPLPAD